MSEPWRRRVALLVGIDKYASKPLNNAARDARAVEHTLIKEGGFAREDVVCLPNPTRGELLKAIAKFKSKVFQLKGQGEDQGCLALFYYAGHGLIDSNSQHYLLPTDFEILDEEVSWNLEAFGCSLKYVLEALDNAYAGIVLIDACRELQQFSASKASISQQVQSDGAAQRGWGGDAIGADHHQQNLLVGHSCAPRRSASDGLGQGTFTAHLVKELCNPAHRHVMDAVLEVNVKVYKDTRTSVNTQQPRLDLSARPGLFDSFRLERLPVQEAAHLTQEQRRVRDLIQGLSDPSRNMGFRQDMANSLVDLLQETDNNSYLNLLVDLEGVPLLLGVLKEKQASNELRLSACQIVTMLGEAPHHRELLAAKGAGPILLQQFITESDRPGCPAHAAAWEALQRVILSKVAKVSMLHRGGVLQLVECLGSCCRHQHGPGLGGALGGPECVRYASTAIQLLSSLLCNNHCYAQRALRVAAHSDLPEVLKVVTQHRAQLEAAEPWGVKLLHKADEMLKSLKESLPTL